MNRCMTLSTLLLIAGIGWLSSGRARAGIPLQQRIDHVYIPIDEARPLARAAIELEQRFGIRIGYEDAEWVNEKDVIRAGDHPGNIVLRPEVLLVRAGRIDLRFDSDRNTGRPTDPPEKILQDLLEEHVRRNNSGEFRAIQVGDGYSIVAARYLDKDGNLVPYSSPLDTLISLPEETRGGMATIELICDAIRAASGHRISPGLIASGALLMNSTVRVGANNEKARDVLARAISGLRLGEPQQPMVRSSWALYYDPHSKSFPLHFREMRQRVPTLGSGELSLAPVYAKD